MSRSRPVSSVGGGTHYGTPEVEGGPVPVSGQEVEVPFKHVAPEFFRTLRIPLVAGRTFSRDRRLRRGHRQQVAGGSARAGRWSDRPAVQARPHLAVGDDCRRGRRRRTAGRGNRTPFYIYRRLAPAAAASGPPPRVRGYATRVGDRARRVSRRRSFPRCVLRSGRCDRNQPAGPDHAGRRPLRTRPLPASDSCCS